MAGILGAVNPCWERVFSSAWKRHAALSAQFNCGQDGGGKLLIGWGFDV